MAKVIKFRMEQVFREHFVRDYEFLSDSTLFEVNMFIGKELGHDVCDMKTFHLADKNGNILETYDAVLIPGDEEAECAMDKVRLCDIITSADRHLLWIVEVMKFDGDFFDSLTNIEYSLNPIDVSDPNPEFTYPRVAFAHGDTFGSDDDEDYEDEKSIFDEMMDEFGDFGGDDSYDDEY